MQTEVEVVWPILEKGAGQLSHVRAINGLTGLLPEAEAFGQPSRLMVPKLDCVSTDVWPQTLEDKVASPSRLGVPSLLLLFPLLFLPLPAIHCHALEYLSAA